MKTLIYCTIALSLSLFTACEPSKTGGTGNSTDTLHQDTVVVAAPVPPVYNSPEGAASDGEFLYVSNLGVEREPSKKDGDGRIMKLNMDANDWIDQEKWAAIKLDAPKGMAIIGKNLYVSDIDRLVCIDLKKNEQTYVYDFARMGTKFLNDVAVMNDSTLLVSATDINAIFKVNLNDQNFEKMKTGELNGPNGLVYSSEDNKIYCVEYGSKARPAGRVLAIDGNSGAVRQIGTHTGGLDGVAMAADGTLLFTDWNIAHIAKIGMTRPNDVKELNDSIQGPADFYYDTKTGKKYVPAMLEDALHIVTAE